MEKIKNILFASNLSKEMEDVFKYAATTAVSQNANIVVLHVMEENAQSERRMKTAFGTQIYKDLKTKRRDGAQNILVGKKVDAIRIRQAIAGFFQENKSENTDNAPGLISKILITESRSIANEIVTTAVDEGCSLIAIGCRQQGLLAETMGDNVVRKVLRRTTVPVLAVPIGK